MISRFLQPISPVLAVALWGAGCNGITGPPVTSGMRIEVQVSGGFAGVSYAFEASGRDGVVRGLTCVSGCDFQAEEVLLPLSTVQVRALAEDMEATGILELDGTDFGSPCCDHFEFVVTYESGSRTATVRGNSQALPADLGVVVDRLLRMTQGTTPIVVDLEGLLAGLPTDPLSLGETVITGDVLEATVTYSGGCENHEIDMVATGGWLESLPVQVHVLVSHEDNDDPCDALPTETRSFDLRPLAAAYEVSYGVAAPGSTTLILRIEDEAEPGGVRLVEYVF